MRREGSRPSCLPFAGHLVSSPALTASSPLASLPSSPHTVLCLLPCLACLQRPTLAISVHPKPCGSSSFRLFQESPSCFHNGCDTYNAHQQCVSALLSPHPRRRSLFDCCLFCGNAYSEVLKRQNSDFVVAFSAWDQTEGAQNSG